MRLSILFLMCSFFSITAIADSNVDKIDELNGVSLESSKEEALRSYSGKVEKTFNYPIELVKKSVTNFTEKCNNDFRSKRQFTQENVDCKYHNDHLVESFIVRDIRPMEYFKDLSEYYLIGRQVYNRGSFGYYELVQIRNGVNEKNQKTITVILRMLGDDEVKFFTTPKFSKESAFDRSTATYVLTEISPNVTQLNYQYSADTDHWLLNKEISVPQVFASISKSINGLVKTIEDEASLQKRELASKE